MQSNELVARTPENAAAVVDKYLTDPGGFLEDILGMQLDTWQRVVCDSIAERVKKCIAETLAADDPDDVDRNIRIAVSSGHGIGKTALTAGLNQWFIAVHPDPYIVCTANTKQQLTEKTWRELAKWHQQSLLHDWFEWTATQFRHKDSPSTWFATAVPQTEHNSEAFAGVHEKYVLQIFDEACHDDQTEVLTDVGWKYFSKLSGKERLLSMNPENHVAEYLKPSAIHNYDHDGDMILCDKRGANFCVTLNHEMYCRSYRHRLPNNWTSWGKHKIGDLVAKTNRQMIKTILWVGKETDHYIIPVIDTARKHFEPKTVLMDKWLRFLGWYFSEGHTIKDEHDNCKYIGITNDDEEVLSEIESLVKSLGFKSTRIYSTTTPQIHVYNMQLGRHLGKYGRNCLEKRLPRFISSLSVRQIEIFLSSFLIGDGYSRSSGRDIFYTSSSQMADDLHELILKTGCSSVKTIRNIKGQKKDFGTHIATSSCDGYVISRQQKPGYITYRPDIDGQLISYKGKVYCAEVPLHHLLFTRRNGYTLWSGNSKIPSIIFDVAEGASAKPGGYRIWLIFGNPTNNTGGFYDACFGAKTHRWHQIIVDARDCKYSDQRLIGEWLKDHGDDSDFFRVRVKGLPPRQSITNLIGTELAEAAVERHLMPGQYDFAPKILSVDSARFGDDETVVSYRQGMKLHWQKVYHGLSETKIAEKVLIHINEVNPDTTFFDVTGGYGAGAHDILKDLGYRVVSVNFAEKKGLDEEYENLRIAMWDNCRVWLERADIPNDQTLVRDLTTPDYFYNKTTGKKQLESKDDLKKRLGRSPDKADSLVISFAYPVKKQIHQPAPEEPMNWRAI